MLEALLEASTAEVLITTPLVWSCGKPAVDPIGLSARVLDWAWAEAERSKTSLQWKTEAGQRDGVQPRTVPGCHEGPSMVLLGLQIVALTVRAPPLVVSSPGLHSSGSLPVYFVAA